MKMEAQRVNLGGFVRACLAAGWLEYRQLRYYPASLILAAAQQLTPVGVWYFVGRFLSAGASESVRSYGGNYVAYIMVGVLLNQVALAALDGPFQIISEAFWDMRLETYRLAVHGIRANILGRVGWQVLFAGCMQLLAFSLVLVWAGIPVPDGVNVPLIVLALLLLMGSNIGLGLAGASLFFLLEVKSGQEPHHLGLPLSGNAGKRAICPGGAPARLAPEPGDYITSDPGIFSHTLAIADRGRLDFLAGQYKSAGTGPVLLCNPGQRVRPAQPGT